MKSILTFLFLILTEVAFTQSALPDFLQGTWKAEDKELYEHWDKLNENTLKGFSYTMKNGEIKVSEYLDISRTSNAINYTAAVPNQNKGEGMIFKLTKADSSFTFENPDHDFPKKIVYNKLSDTEILVQLSGDYPDGFSFKMRKLNVKVSETDTSISNPDYDSALAQKLGADDYGMKGYILVMLKTGTNQTTDKTFINNSFRGHLDNINRLVDDGKLIVAGPLGKNDKTYRGIFVLDVKTIEEAEALLQSDPAIKEDLLDFELYKWYGSAALPEYLETSGKIWKTSP